MLIRILLITVFLLGAAPARAQEPTERKNIDALTPEELAAYKHAIDLIKKSTDLNNNYLFHAKLHNEFSTVPPHGCEHGNDLFFPWHRYHLHYFEQALRATDPNHPTLSTKNVRIPYWAWTSPASGSRYPKAFEDTTSPLFHAGRNTEARQPLYSKEYMTNLIRDNSDWNRFAGGPKDAGEYYGALEQPAHNLMHGNYIGGDMGDPNFAAEDPIYWSYHAFIDMQWDRWQKIHRKEPTCLACPLQGFPAAPTTALVRAVEALGYFYRHAPEDIAPAPPALVAALQPKVIPLKATLPEAEKRVAVWGGEGPFAFQLNLPAPVFQRTDLWLTGVRVPQTISYAIDAYLHPKQEAFAPGRPEFQTRYFLGRFGLWKGHGHGQTTNIFLPVTAQLRRLVAAGANENWIVTLAVTPILPSPRPGASTQPQVRALSEEVQFRGVVLSLDGGKVSASGGGGGGHHGR